MSQRQKAHEEQIVILQERNRAKNQEIRDLVLQKANIDANFRRCEYEMIVFKEKSRQEEEELFCDWTKKKDEEMIGLTEECNQKIEKYMEESKTQSNVIDTLEEKVKSCTDEIEKSRMCLADANDQKIAYMMKSDLITCDRVALQEKLEKVQQESAYFSEEITKVQAELGRARTNTAVIQKEYDIKLDQIKKEHEIELRVHNYTHNITIIQLYIIFLVFIFYLIFQLLGHLPNLLCGVFRC